MVSLDTGNAIIYNNFNEKKLEQACIYINPGGIDTGEL